MQLCPTPLFLDSCGRPGTRTQEPEGPDLQSGAIAALPAFRGSRLLLAVCQRWFHCYEGPAWNGVDLNHRPANAPAHRPSQTCDQAGPVAALPTELPSQATREGRANSDHRSPPRLRSSTLLLQRQLCCQLHQRGLLLVCLSSRTVRSTAEAEGYCPPRSERWDRTTDHAINNRELCQLSYLGTAAEEGPRRPGRSEETKPSVSAADPHLHSSRSYPVGTYQPDSHARKLYATGAAIRA